MSWKINEKLGRHETTYNAYEFYVEDLQSLAISRKYYFQREREFIQNNLGGYQHLNQVRNKRILLMSIFPWSTFL